MLARRAGRVEAKRLTLYLKTDVILLAELFENFRNNCLAAYELDPAHYYTTPGLSWDAMLKNTQVLFT